MIIMNPYDAINHDTKQNSDDEAKKNKSLKNSRDKTNNKVTRKSSSNRTNNSKNEVITKPQKNRLKEMYSTDRINRYVLIHLKALQIISGDKSRSDLEEKMIKIVEPKIINSVKKRNKYKKLLEYAIKGIELKRKMN